MWVPVVEQTTRTGVLAVTVPEASQTILAQTELLGVFAGLVVAAAARVSDVPYMRRRGRDMSLPASMQWDLLPPLSTRIAGALIAGVLEAAYDIAGDAFDYAVNGGACISRSSTGWGTASARRCSPAWRSARTGTPAGTGPRSPASTRPSRALTGYYGDHSFATGIIARLATGAGPAGVDLRGAPAAAAAARPQGGRRARVRPDAAVRARRRRPRPSICELEPDDAVLLYTDGVIEARTPDGELFGLDRLADLLEREAASGQPAEELLRRLVQAVLDHQAGGLRDDATLLLVQWTGR